MKKVVLSSIVLMTLSGCASMGNKIDTNKFDGVSICKTTKSELISLFGEPERSGRQSGYNTLNWQYAHASFLGSESQNVIAFLNNDNVIVDYVINPVGLNVEPTDKCSK